MVSLGLDVSAGAGHPEVRLGRNEYPTSISYLTNISNQGSMFGVSLGSVWVEFQGSLLIGGPALQVSWSSTQLEILTRRILLLCGIVWVGMIF